MNKQPSTCFIERQRTIREVKKRDKYKCQSELRSISSCCCCQHYPSEITSDECAHNLPPRLRAPRHGLARGLMAHEKDITLCWFPKSPSLSMAHSLSGWKLLLSLRAPHLLLLTLTFHYMIPPRNNLNL